MQKTALATSGGPGPEEYREWLAHGFTLVEARDWLVDGVELGEARLWRERGIATAGAALPLRVRGIPPQGIAPQGVAPQARRKLGRRARKTGFSSSKR